MAKSLYFRYVFCMPNTKIKIEVKYCTDFSKSVPKPISYS